MKGENIQQMRNISTNTAIFSVVYPGGEQYVPEFLKSLSRQTNRDFTLFLINDGLPNLGRLLEGFDLPVKVREETGLPAALRKTGIEWVLSEGAEAIVFADADDYFADNRVEVSKRILADYDVIFNELMLVGTEIIEPTPILGQHFKEREQISTKHILSGNCMGLGNTSIRADKISLRMSEIPEDIIAFDWALFALCLHAGARTIFTQSTRTYYRQYDNNVASPNSYTEEQILRGVRVKQDHYRVLSRFYEEYARFADLYRRLLYQLQSDVLLKQKYCHAVQAQSSTSQLWWESIKSLEELGL